MQRQQIDFGGRLNKDDALPTNGDYRDAKNIIKSTSLTGGGNSIKKLPSITSLATVGSGGEVVCATVSTQNIVYAVKKIDSDKAAVWQIADGVATKLLTYEHGTPTIEPQIVTLGNVLVWNYAKSDGFDGVVLSWKIGRPYTTISASDLYQIHFAKPIPTTLSATPDVNGGANNEFRDTKWDFACQYVYDSGEVSALSDFLSVFPEEDKSTTHYGLNGIGSIVLNADIDHPEYAVSLIYYARANDGTWRRVTTLSDIGTSTSFRFKGVLNEALPTEVSAKPFDAVPLTASTIEVIANRIFLGNIQDDLGGSDSGASIAITPDSSINDTGLSGGSLDSPLSYFKVASGTNAVSEGVVDTVSDNGANNLVRDRLANDSTYFIGWQFHDHQGRTRGVEHYEEFTTGMFDFPTRVDNLRLEVPTANIPSWAKYFQVVISNNRKKDFFVESYGTGKGYELLNADGSTRLANFAADSDNIESIVISTLVKYTFQKGDLINLQVSPMSSSREYKTLRVKGYADGLLYIEPSEDLNADLFQSSEYLHFEIYSPADVGEAPVFRATGDVKPISDLVADAFTVGKSGVDISNPSGLSDSFLMKQKISPKTNIVSSQWTTMAWRKQNTADEYTIYNNGIAADLGFTNKFTKVEENSDRATFNESGGNGITLNPPTILQGSTDEELGSYEYSNSLTSPFISTVTSDVEVTGLRLTPTISGLFDVSWNFDVDEVDDWDDPYVDIVIRVGTSFNDASVQDVKLIRVNSGNRITNISGSQEINIPSGHSVFFVVLNGSNPNSLEIPYSGSSSAVATESALSQDANRTGDYLLHARVNIEDVDVSGTPELTIELAVDGTPTYTVVSGEVLADSLSDGKRSYDAIFDHPATGNEKITLLVTLSVGDQASGTKSFRIGNGTSLSAVLKSDRELYTVSIEENGEPQYFLARRNSKVDSVVEWRKPAGKPSLDYENNPLSDLSNKFRWGDKYVVNAKTNPISSFFFADQDEVPSESGGITALVRTSNMGETGSVLLAICAKETFSIYIQESVLRDVGGSSQLIASDEVIGSIQPLSGSFGSSHKRSISAFANRVVYWDNRRKDWIRYSTEGLVPLGGVYKMKSQFDNKDSDAISFYDPFHDIFVVGFTGDDKMYIFQNREGFVSELDVDLSSDVFINAGVLNNKSVVFKNDTAYTSSGSGFGSYFGVASSVGGLIKLPVISATPIMPLGLSLRSRQWTLATDFTTNNRYIKNGVFEVVVTNENNQQTTMPSSYFRFDSGMIYSDVFKDENTDVVHPRVNGLDLSGLFHEIEITMSDITMDDQLEDIVIDYQILSGR